MRKSVDKSIHSNKNKLKSIKHTMNKSKNSTSEVVEDNSQDSKFNAQVPLTANTKGQKQARNKKGSKEGKRVSNSNISRLSISKVIESGNVSAKSKSKNLNLKSYLKTKCLSTCRIIPAKMS